MSTLNTFDGLTFSPMKGNSSLLVTLSSYILPRVQTCLDWKNCVWGGWEQEEETGTLVLQMFVLELYLLKLFTSVEPT